MVQSCLFDIGNVILAFDFMKAARKIEPFSRCSAEEGLALVSALTDPLERGEITTDEFYDKASEMIGYEGERDFMKRSFEDIFEVNEPIVQLIEALHSNGVPLHLLSNTNGIHVPFFESTYPVFDCFQGRIYSHEAGCMKPDPKIYEIAEKQLDLTPTETLYIDDLPANCEAGKEAGFVTVQYDRNDHGAFLAETAQILKTLGL